MLEWLGTLFLSWIQPIRQKFFARNQEIEKRRFEVTKSYYDKWMALGRRNTQDPLVSNELDSLLDQIGVLGKKFNNQAKACRLRKNQFVPTRDTAALSKMDEIFNEEMEKLLK